MTNASGDAELESVGLILAVMTEKHCGKSSRCVPPHCINGIQVLLVVNITSKVFPNLHLFLCLSTARAPRWKGYFDFLPKDIPGMPMFWDSDQLCHLEGTSLHEKMSGSKATPDKFVEPPCQVLLACIEMQSRTEQLSQLQIVLQCLIVSPCYSKLQSR